MTPPQALLSVPALGEEPLPDISLCCVAETGGVWVVKLYLAGTNAHLGCWQLLWWLGRLGTVPPPSTTLTFPHGVPEQVLQVPISSPHLQLKLFPLQGMSSATALPGRFLPLLINSYFFHEAFQTPARHDGFPRKRFPLGLDPSSLSTSCLLTPDCGPAEHSLGPSASAHHLSRALGFDC